MKVLSVRRCTTQEEKEEAKRFRQKHFFDERKIEDPYAWTLQREDHGHFALYNAGQMIGYAHIQYWPEHRAALRIIVIDAKERGQGYGAFLLKACEQKLREVGVKVLHTEAAPDAVEFYVKLGYTNRPFDDPAGNSTHPNDTPMGKRL